MKKRILIVCALFCLLPSLALGQAGKPDGIQKEFYPDGKLKFEYLVKSEKFNGFYERYDEEGALEYRQYFIDGIFDGTDREHYYYPLFSWYHHIGDEGQEVRLDPEEALELFGQHYEFADAPFENDPIDVVVTRMPVDNNGEKYPVILAGISKNYLYLKEFKERKGVEHREHHYYDLVRKYRVARDDVMDSLFNADVLLEIFERRHTGIEFGTPYGSWRKREGSRLWSVQQYLGQPDYVFPLDPGGWFDVYYETENLRLVGHNSSVYFIEQGRPEWVAPKYRNKKQ